MGLIKTVAKCAVAATVTATALYTTFCVGAAFGAYSLQRRKNNGEIDMDTVESACQTIDEGTECFARAAELNS